MPTCITQGSHSARQRSARELPAEILEQERHATKRTVRKISDSLLPRLFVKRKDDRIQGLIACFRARDRRIDQLQWGNFARTNQGGLTDHVEKLQILRRHTQRLSKPAGLSQSKGDIRNLAKFSRHRHTEAALRFRCPRQPRINVCSRPNQECSVRFSWKPAGRVARCASAPGMKSSKVGSIWRGRNARSRPICAPRDGHSLWPRRPNEPCSSVLAEAVSCAFCANATRG